MKRHGIVLAMRRVNGAREREPVSVERIVGRRIDGVELVAVGDGRLAPRLQSLTRISCRKSQRLSTHCSWIRRQNQRCSM